MADNKNQGWKNEKKLSPSTDNDQLGENNGESNCGCGGANTGSTNKSAGNKSTCK